MSVVVRIVLKTLVLVLLLCVCLTTSQAQNLKNRVLKVKPWPNAPIELTSLSSNTGPIRSEESVLTGETWLQGLSLRLKNVSKKPIIGIRYTLLLPKLEGKSLPLGVSVEYGQILNEADVTTAKSDSIAIAPSSEVVLSLDEDLYKDIVFNVERTGSKSMSNVVTAILILQEVSFDDGTRWVGGSILSANGAENKVIETPTSNMVFCGQVLSSTTITCCRNKSRGCFNTVSRITLTQTTGTGVGICSSFFFCRCDLNVECTSQFTYSCEGSIFDCGLSL